MPELPEVETIVRRFRPLLEGRRIVAFRSRWAKNALPSVAAVRAGLTGHTIRRLTRRGKFIVFELNERGFLLLHLRMSGRLEWQADHRRTPRHVRAAWDLDHDDRLLFCDARKFGRMTYTTDLAAVLAGLGLEPLARSFTAGAFVNALRGRARAIKPLLLDQSIIAGIGNIYADEALHRAGIHPLTRSDQLTAARLTALHGAIRAVLREGVRHHGTTIDWVYPSGGMQQRLRVYGRGGTSCQTCGTPVEYLRVGQRGTHICPVCQPLRR